MEPASCNSPKERIFSRPMKSFMRMQCIGYNSLFTWECLLLPSGKVEDESLPDIHTLPPGRWLMVVRPYTTDLIFPDFLG